MANAVIQDDKWMDKKINLPSSKFKSSAMDKNAEQLSVSSFKWTSTEYTPGQLLDNFQKNMPFLIMTTQGYLGRDDYMNTVASEEIYWLTGTLTMSRIIVENDNNAYFSIPVNCTKLIIPYEGDKQAGPATTIKSLLEKKTYTCFAFQDDNISVSCGPDSRPDMKLGVLLIVDKYDERYMMGHALSSGRLCHEITIIPVYMPIRLLIAARMTSGDHSHFYQVMLNMQQCKLGIQAKAHRLVSIKQCNDIMLQDGVRRDTQYERLSYVPLANIDVEQYLDEEHMYTPLNVDKLQRERPPPIPPKDRAINKASKVKRSVGRLRPSTPPGEEASKRRDSRELPTNIREMIKFGYRLVEVNTSELLGELTEVLKTGVIPETSAVTVTDIQLDVNMAKGKRPYSERQEAIWLPYNNERDDVRIRDIHPPSQQQPEFLAELSNFRAKKKPQTSGSQDLNEIRRESVCHDDDASRLTANYVPMTPLRQDRPLPNSSCNQRTASQTTKKTNTAETSPQVGTGHDVKEQTATTISGLDAIPTDLSALDIEGVGRFLAMLHLPRHRRRFAEELVDGHLLLELDTDILQADFGFSRSEALRLLSFTKKTKAGRE